MDREEIKATIHQLDVAIDKEGAAVQFHQYGGGPDESKIVANEAGYLRLGVEFLKSAYAEKDHDVDDGNSIPVDLEYLISPESDIGFDWFERNETIKPFKEEKWSWKSQIFGFILMAIFFGVIALAIYGAVSLIG
jgi:hypothetical protein